MSTSANRARGLVALAFWSVGLCATAAVLFEAVLR